MPSERRSVILVLFGCAWLAPVVAFAQSVTVTGAVRDGDQPIAGALVCGMDWDADGRIAMRTADCAVTGEDGAYEIATTLVSDGSSNFGQIVVGAEGYLTLDLMVPENETSDVLLEPVMLLGPDNEDYVWWQPHAEIDQIGCGTCHATIVAQWRTSRHAIATEDPWVFDLYDGTTEDGRTGVAPGYKLDHDDAGECGACHAATASWSLGETVDLHEIPEEHQYGVYCETCHKIREVDMDVAGPGTEGRITMWRPGYGNGAGGYAQFAFGPWPNVIQHAMLTSYSPLFRRPELCASCHQYENRQGVPVMDTFTDWLAVGDPQSTVPCQGCHMRDIYGAGGGEAMEWVVHDPHMRQMAAQRRDPADVGLHQIWGGIEYAQHALDLAMSVEQDGDEIVVETTTLNIGANHRVPTGMPFREMILVVSAQTEDGAPLELAEGPLVGPRGGELAGAAGRMFAKSLGDEAGNLTFAFWDATQTLEDTRLATGEEDRSTFRFTAPAAGGAVDVTARLLYRRASRLLADAKGWDVGEQEIGLAEDTIEVEGPAPDADAGPGADAGPSGDGDDFQEGCACSAPASPAPAVPGLALLALVVIPLAARRSRQRGQPMHAHEPP